MVTPARQWLGVYIGRVTKNRAQDLWVTLQVPQILGTTETQWAAPAGFNCFTTNPDSPVQELGWSGDGPGPGPAPGSIVLALFVGGDINSPCYLLCSQKLR